MLNQAVGDLLPSALGVALSPIPIIAISVMLGTPRARTNGPAFAVGWVAGPVIAFVVAPRPTTRGLLAVKEVMVAHSAVIMMVVLLLLGAKNLGQGIGAL